MNYKTILVHVDDTRGADARIAFAARLAVAHGAHLVGVVQTGVMRYVYGTAPDGYIGDPSPLFEDLRNAAERQAGRFEMLARQAGAASIERRIGDDEPGYALATQAMYADLVIVGQADPGNASTAHAALPEFVALHAPCPVLVTPFAMGPNARAERVEIAWNASPESAHAVRQALPLLLHAQQVEVVMFERGDGERPSLGGPDIGLLLTRHGVNVRVRQETAAGDVADALLARVHDHHADVLVMGCYGHSRLREIVLGGVSRKVLRAMAVPTLLAH